MTSARPRCRPLRLGTRPVLLPSLLPLLLLSLVLSACERSATTAPLEVPGEEPPRGLVPRGLVEVRLSGIGTEQLSASAVFLPLRSPGGGASLNLSGVPGGDATLQFVSYATSSFTDGVRGSGGVRYLTAQFRVRNAMSDGTPYGNQRQNLTFMAVATAGTLHQSAVSQLNRFDGSAANAALALQLRPTGAVARGLNGALLSQGADVLQLFSEADAAVAANAAPPAVTQLFPYGFMVRNIHNGSRTLPASPAAEQYDGIVTFAFKLPLQASATQDPFTISVMMLAMEDSQVRLTQSLEEQNPAGEAALEARASALGATQITLLPGGSYGGAVATRQLCQVRIAGPPEAPTAYLQDDVVCANEDSYEALGNHTLQIGAAAGLLANDEGTGTLSVVPETVATQQGGSAVLAADGSFEYLSAAGFTGTDEFSYTLTNGSQTASGRAVLTLASRVWHVDNSGSAPGDGRDQSPFTTLKAAESASGAGETILVREGNGTSAGLAEGVVLKANQSLIGQGITSAHTATLNGETITLLSPGGAPQLTRTTAGTTVQLSTNNTVRGVAIASTAGAGISGSSFGSFTAEQLSVAATGGPALDLTTGSVTASFASLSSTNSTATGLNLVGLQGTLSAPAGSISGAAGVAFNVSGGDAAISYGGSLGNTAARVVSISSRTGGTVTLSGSISESGTGILVQNNTGGTVSFSGSSKTLNTGSTAAVTLSSNTGATIGFSGGGLAITTTSGAGFSATGGGTVTVTGSNNTISASGGTALTIQNTNIGASNVTFRSITATGNRNAIVLNNTGTTGGLKVSGDGATASSGGIITLTGVTATDSAAFSLTNTANVSLEFVRVAVTTGGGAGGIAAINLSGTNLVRNSVFDYNQTTPDPVPLHNAYAMRFVQDNTNATITVDGSSVNGTRAGSSAGVLSAMGNSEVNFNVIDSNTSDGFQSLYTDLFGSGWVIGAGDNAGSTATVNLTVRDTRFTNAAPNGTNNLEMSAFQNATMNYKIKDNLFQNVANASAIAGIINVNTLQSGRFGGTAGMDSIVGNTITNSGTGTPVAELGYIGVRIALENNVTGIQHRVVVANNTITDLWRQGMLLSSRGQNNGYNIRVQNNVVGTSILPVGQSNRRGIEVELQASSAMNIELINNSVHGAGTVDAAAALALRTGIEAGTATLNATVTGNTLRSTSAGTTGRFRAETAGTGTGVMCLDLRSNTLEDNTKLYTLTHSAGTFRVEGAGTGAVNNAAIQAQNTVGTGNVTGTVNFNNDVNCTQPVL